MDYLLGIDVGTGGTRAVLVDPEGRVLFSASAEHAPIHSEHIGWAEQDPDSANRNKPILGANDAASGVAVLLELARVLKDHPPAVGRRDADFSRQAFPYRGRAGLARASAEAAPSDLGSRAVLDGRGLCADVLGAPLHSKRWTGAGCAFQLCGLRGWDQRARRDRDHEDQVEAGRFGDRQRSVGRSSAEPGGARESGGRRERTDR